jgi:hypothetical protein
VFILAQMHIDWLNMSICICICLHNVIFVSKLLGVHLYTHVHILGPPLAAGSRRPVLVEKAAGVVVGRKKKEAAGW